LATTAAGYIMVTNTFIADFLTGNIPVKINAWNHVTLTRNSANLYSLYMNGVPAGSATYAGSIGEYQSYIGYNTYDGSSQQFHLKDFRVTKGVVRTVSVPTSPYKAQ
jgi:hypothetical protein